MMTMTMIYHEHMYMYILYCIVLYYIILYYILYYIILSPKVKIECGKILLK